MALITCILAVVSVVLNVFLMKVIRENQINIANKYESIIELEKTNGGLIVEIERNKDIVSEERRAMIAENSNYKTQMESMKEKMAEFTELKLAYFSEMDNLNHSVREMTPEKLLELREKASKGTNLHDFTGIYILENKTYDKYYVGQSISVYKRAGSHFTGDGNKDIYEDYMNGSEWTVRLIALSNSGFKSINALEKHFIEYHHSTYNGYNRTIGNRN